MQMPDAQAFVDSVLQLTDWSGNWLLPIGYTATYSMHSPFYFIDSIGTVYNGWNHREMALCGILFKGERLYGEQKNFYTGINEDGQPKINFELKQNYPNPFNPVTTIEFDMEKAQQVELTVFDIAGNKIQSVFKGHKSAGKYHFKFDGSKLASGVYFYKLQSATQTQVKKMVLLK